jgi:hypothetical protein
MTTQSNDASRPYLRSRAKKIRNTPPEKATEMLRDLASEMTAYTNAGIRLRAQGVQFDAGDLDVTVHSLRNLKQVLEALITDQEARK